MYRRIQNCGSNSLSGASVVTATVSVLSQCVNFLSKVISVVTDKEIKIIKNLFFMRMLVISYE